MRKKAFMVAVAISALLVSLCGMQSVEVSKAESININQPTIRLISPIPIRAYNSSSIELRLEITKPTYWFLYGWFYKPSSSSSGIPFDPRDLAEGYGCIGRMDYLECILDANTIQTFSINDYAPYAYSNHPLSTKLLFSQSIGVTGGSHLLRITAFGSFYTDSYYPNGSRIKQIVNCSAETSFSVWYTSPKISVASPENRTYIEKTVPITFYLDRPASCTYSLDENSNLSLAGNTTLTELTEGQHSLVVYAKDPAGNEGKSDTILFNIAPPAPSPTPSPTTEPTLTPSPSADVSETGDFTLPLVLAAVVVVAVVVALALYFEKHKKS